MNQCDGCMTGELLIAGTHYDEFGRATTVCTKHKYGQSSLTEVKWSKQEDLLRPDAYTRLRLVFSHAHAQASGGKGLERHATKDEPFEKQKICEIRGRVGSGYTLGQAIKKCIESQRLPKERAIAELLGAINYIAAEVICLEDTEGDE